MSSIGKGKTVIQVISDKYLKSYYCMIEAYKISKDTDKTKRVFYAVLDDTMNISEGIDSETYLEYWQELLISKIKKSADTKQGKLVEYEQIYHFIDKFINKINKEVHLKISYSDLSLDTNDKTCILKKEKKDTFDKFINTILKKSNPK
jgi:protoporphyrinogen oxidase